MPLLQHSYNIFSESFAYGDLNCADANNVAFDCGDFGNGHQEGSVRSNKCAGR